jgi:hypothetical protein
MSTIIKYNNQEILSPTPFVELSRELVFVGDKWQNVDKIKLNGQLTGNFNQLISGQKKIIDTFNQNFRNFEILEEDYLIGNLIGSNSIGFINNALAWTVNWSSLKPDTKYALFYKNKFNNIIGARDVNVFAENGNGVACCSFAKKILVAGPTFISNYFSHGIYLSNSLGSIRAIFASPAFPDNTTYYNQANLDNVQDDTFYLKEIFNKIYEKSGIVVDSISFDNSVYNGILNYNIDLTSKELKYNVQNPVNEFSFSEDENKILNVSHRVSAQGMNTSSTIKSNALDNAINFVKTFSGISNIPTVNFINKINNNFYLKDVKESINRLNSTYSIDETYVNDLSPYATSGGILRYSIDVNSGAQSNVTEIKIQGDFTGPNFGKISDLRSAINITSLLSGSYSGYFNTIPLSYNITENSGENKISFDYSFDNIPLPNPYFDYKVDVSRDELSQIANININGEIIARGNRQNRYNLSLSNLDAFTGNFLSVAQSGLAQYNYLNDLSNSYNLRLINIQVDKNPNEGKITASAKYDDKSMPPSGFSDGGFSINVNAPYWYMKPNATCNVKGYYIIQDFDILTLPKESISLDLVATNDPSLTEEQFKNIAKNLANRVDSKDYPFDFVSQEQTDITKKYNKSESLYKISYNIEKIATTGNNQLLPKFK